MATEPFDTRGRRSLLDRLLGRGAAEEAFAFPNAAPVEAGPPASLPLPRADEPEADGELDAAIERLQMSVVAGLRGRDTQRIPEAFNAPQPVGDRYQLSGRLGELELLVKAVIDGWKHAVIYGARGVGKTSLARVFGDLVDEAGRDVFYYSASGDIAFEEIVRAFARFIAEGGARGAQASLAALGEHFGASDAADWLATIGQRRVFLILDEFDRIANPRTRAELAALLKLLSDVRAPAQFVIVGISTDVDTLIHEHPSLRRHMVAVQVGPIAPDAITALLTEGARRAGVAFDPAVLDALAALSIGSPYHARLFALNVALETARGPERRADAAAFWSGLDTAWAEWAGVSPSTARLFGRVTAAPELRDALADLAILAGQEHAFDAHRLDEALGGTSEGAAQQALDAIKPELKPTQHKIAFDDSLAPQFLLLATLRGVNRNGAIDLASWAGNIRGRIDRLGDMG